MNKFNRTTRITAVLFLTLCLLPLSLKAQMWGRGRVISPEIHEDNSVTFRLFAPDASTVKIAGNWMPGWGTTQELVRNDTGLYELTIDPLPSEMYTYAFVVDGVRSVDPGNGIIVRDGIRNESMFFVPGGKADLYETQKVPHGQLSKVWYPSPTLDKTRLMYVYTPPDYYKTEKKYPVLYLLHGGGGDEDAWTTLGRAPQILDNLIAQGKSAPMIVIMTNGNPGQAAAPGARPKQEPGENVFNPGGMGNKKFEESLVKDVIPFVEVNYRCIQDKDHRAVTGLSMGGIQTMNLASTYPEMFSWYGVMSMGLVDMSRFGVEDNPEERVASLEALRKSSPKLYWIACGKEDFLHESAVNLTLFLDENNFPYVYRESGGGHTWTNWRIFLSEFAPMLFK